MIDRFEIIGHDLPRPEAERILFCDGTGGNLFRAETDIELSHWRPNRTPVEYRAGTSTEICFKFLDKPRPGSWTAAVNNHVNVDGILSVYALVHSDHALAHRQTIIEAAEMGDFWGWGEPHAQRLFQGITHLMQKGGEPQAIYAEAFRRIPGLIDSSDPQIPQIEESLAPLRDGIELVEQGRIVRREIDARLAQYVILLAVAGDDDARASYVPEFNEAISSKALLWPRVRACWDAERVCLVSVERKTGWFHDLWFPGYLWADTDGKWIVPGMTYHDGMSRYKIENDRLITAFEELQQKESASGQWALGGTRLPFGDELHERFPLVGRFLNDQCETTISRLLPQEVADALVAVFD
jgi:hypothetical protein